MGQIWLRLCTFFQLSLSKNNKIYDINIKYLLKKITLKMGRNDKKYKETFILICATLKTSMFFNFFLI